MKREIVVKTEPEDESYIGCPQGLGATVPGVPSVPGTGEQRGWLGEGGEVGETRSPPGWSPPVPSRPLQATSRTDCWG